MGEKIFTVRPPNEDHKTSVEVINKEILDAGLTVQGITRGITQPNGETVYWVYIST